MHVEDDNSMRFDVIDLIMGFTAYTDDAVVYFSLECVCDDAFSAEASKMFILGFILWI